MSYIYTRYLLRTAFSIIVVAMCCESSIGVSGKIFGGADLAQIQALCVTHYHDMSVMNIE